MVTRSQRVEIPEHNPKIERACHRSNANTRKRRMGETNRGNNRNRGNEADPLEHTLQDYLTSMVGITTSIMLPNLGDLNFELRHRLINMIERMQFHGLPSKDLVLHLKKFLRIIGTMKSPTTTPDYIKLDAFMFLLGVKAED